MLEVSGIRKGDNSRVKARVKQKKQTKLSDGKYPAYIIVVEFSIPLSFVARFRSEIQEKHTAAMDERRGSFCC